MNKKPFLRFIISLVVMTAILFFLLKIWLIVMPFLVAYIIQFILRPFVNFLEQREIKHGTAVVIVFIIFFGSFILFLRLFVPAAITEMLSIQDNFAEYNEALDGKIDWLELKLVGKFGSYSDFINTQNLNLKDKLQTYMSDKLLVVMKKMPSFILSILPLVLYVFVIPFATFFFLLDEYRLKKFFISRVPNKYFEATLNLVHSLNQQFVWLLRGMFISACIISTLVSTGLWIIGLEYPILVGIFSGLANLIPYAGPMVGVVAAFIVAMMTGADSIFFLYILLVFLTVNLMDNVFVQPLILSRAANLHPLVIIFLVLLGSKMGGILGMLLAVPLASLLQVAVKILYKELTRPLRKDFSEYQDMDLVQAPLRPTPSGAESII